MDQLRSVPIERDNFLLQRTKSVKFDVGRYLLTLYGRVQVEKENEE